MGASIGMQITAGTTNNCAQSATAWAWLPDEKAITPRSRSSGASVEILLYAPRNLKAPPRCNCSHLNQTEIPASASKLRLCWIGVWCATPSRRSAAADTSASETAYGDDDDCWAGGVSVDIGCSTLFSISLPR